MSYLMGDNPDAQQYHNHSYSQLPTPPASSYAAEPAVLPKVGQTRCYWALLSSDLQFIYLDPVLNYHLDEQAELLVGKSLLSFVHPDEQASAKRDLGSVLETKTLHGSVTRVRYSRLSSIRRQLGYQGPGPDWVDADKISLDKNYLAVDLVINWAADGLVLCFIHAVVDLNSIADNDEVHKTDWTNWCGTPWMPPEQTETLHNRFLMCVPQTGTMSRVFQILLNERERPLLLSWPPDSTQGPHSGDFAKLVENVQISAGVPGESDAKTSCTRRYKALQDMPAVLGYQVESIFIPHGTIIFACHKVNSIPPRTSTAMNQVDYAHYAHYYDQPAPYNMSPLPAHDAAYSNGFPNNAYSPHRWQSALTQNIHNLRSEYPVASPPAWSSASPSASSTSTYHTSGPPSAAQAPFDRPLSPPPSYNTNYAPMSSGASSSSSTVPVPAATNSDMVPPSRRRVSPTSARDRDPGTSHGHGPGSGPGPIRGSTATSGAAVGVSKPSGILKCSSCKTTQSPEWRKGPSGKKELCNACGLRYARSRAKKEGPLAAPSRRRKVDLTKRESATPPTSSMPYPPPTTTGLVRRNLTDTGHSASPSGDIYAAHHHRHHHPHHHVLDNHLTPSPSPPASAGVVTATGVPNVGYVHYTTGSGHAGHGHDINSRPHPPYSNTSNMFYSTPSPLSGVQHVAQQQQQQNHSPPEPTPSPTSSHHQQMHSHPHSRQHHPQRHASAHTQLPPLEQIKATIPSPMPPSAYEQERELRGQQQQQHVPLTPLSAGDSRDGYRKAM